jgi:beta-lysine 5,6-aminomutase beta subunit
MIVRPYGDTRDDGVIQLSFTLPVGYSVKAPDIGKQFLEKLGFHSVAIGECRGIDPSFTFYVAYARTDVGIDPEEVKGDYLELEVMDYYAINTLIEKRLGRKLVVVGAAIESDAHTVGIDAIMNMKGYAGNYGLERYPQMDALNMGSQIPCEQPCARRSRGVPTPSWSARSSPRRTSTCSTSHSSSSCSRQRACASASCSS